MTLLYPGSFNPVHRGHIRLAQYMLSLPEVDEVWFVVSPSNPLKDAHTLWDEQLRLSLLKLAVHDMPAVSVSDVEFRLPRPSFTANTLRTLSAQYPERSFALLIGEDNQQVFSRWREHDFILENYPVYVYPRGAQASACPPPFRYLKDAPLCDISSTQIRARLQQLQKAPLSKEQMASDEVLCWLPEPLQTYFADSFSA